VLQLASHERLVHVVELAAREDPIHETREPWRAVEILRVRGQDDLAAPLPALEAEWAGAHRLDAECRRVAFDDVTRHDLGLAHGEQAHERYGRLGERDLYGVAVERGEARHARDLAPAKLGSTSDVREEVGRAGLEAGIEDAGERIH